MRSTKAVGWWLALIAAKFFCSSFVGAYDYTKAGKECTEAGGVRYGDPLTKEFCYLREIDNTCEIGRDATCPERNWKKVCGGHSVTVPYRQQPENFFPLTIHSQGEMNFVASNPLLSSKDFNLTQRIILPLVEVKRGADVVLQWIASGRASTVFISDAYKAKYPRKDSEPDHDMRFTYILPKAEYKADNSPNYYEIPDIICKAPISEGASRHRESGAERRDSVDWRSLVAMFIVLVIHRMLG